MHVSRDWLNEFTCTQEGGIMSCAMTEFQRE
jgi:hypothetical protein